MSKHKLEIIEWEPSDAALPASTPPSRPEQWSPPALGILGTVLLHSLILQVVILGARASPHRPPDVHPIATLSKPQDPSPSEAIILVDLPSASTKDASLAQSVAALAPSHDELPTAPLSADPPTAVDIPAESDNTNSLAAIDSGDAAAQVAMFGRYTGQIDARIERAWRRPRSAVNAAPPGLRATVAGQSSSPDLFECQVRILQDAQGRVQEVQLLRCNGSIAWQQSLVTAILASSPLPAPPTPAVFTPAIVMRFTALPYTTDRSADDYEFPSTAVASND